EKGGLHGEGQTEAKAEQGGARQDQGQGGVREADIEQRRQHSGGPGGDQELAAFPLLLQASAQKTSDHDAKGQGQERQSLLTRGQAEGPGQQMGEKDEIIVQGVILDEPEQD